MRFAPGLIAVIAVAMGCEASPHDPVPERVGATSGSLTVDWTVNGTNASSSCQLDGAAAIEITIVTNTNQPVGTFQESCSVFNTSVALEQGIYSASARLLDAAGAPRTKLLVIEEFTINNSSQLSESVDFPTASFL
jgi:hypothetical protein